MASNHCLRYPVSPGIKSSDLHYFNFEENGVTRYMSKGSHRHNHHYQHHLYPHHSSYGHLAADGKDKVPGLTVANKVSSGTPILYEDASGHFKKTDVEATKMASPRPALRINISKGEEKRSYEKPPHSPLSPPSSLPDHIKCSLLKAQMDAAFGVGPQVCKEDSCVSGLSKSPSLQSSNVRSPASLRTESTQSTGSSSSKQENRPPRLKKLTRQYSFNHSDEDDLPPALAAVAAESAAEHRAALLLASNGNSQASSVEKSPSKVNSPFALEPGDLLMDFTEATPMIKAYPADPSNSFFDPFTTVQPYPIKQALSLRGVFKRTSKILGVGLQHLQNLTKYCQNWKGLLSEENGELLRGTDGKVDLLETPFQQYSPPAKLSPKRMSPAIHMVPSRQLKNQVQAMQTAHLSHISIVDSSEALKRELEREKMMKRLLMTEL